ncbi:MAG: ROK family protein [Clostridiaceae bacterium]|nr:ROK family protein [Clostridiaceae bacterium]
MKGFFQGSAAMVGQARALYVLIRQKEGVTRQYLSERLKMPATSLNRALERQLSLGLIEEYDLAISSGGRRPGLYRVAGQAYYLLGLDLSGPKKNLVLTDLTLQIAGRTILPDSDETAAADPSAVICEQCRLLPASCHVPFDRVIGLGIVRSGQASAAAAETALAGVIGAELNKPVFTLDGNDAALYAGLWQQRAQAEKPYFFLSIGDDIRFGQALQGQMQAGDLSGRSIGRLLVPLSDKAGGHYLDQIAGIPALLRHYQRIKDDGNLTWGDFCQAIQENKKKAGLVLSEAADAVGTAIQNIMLLAGGNTGDLLLAGPVIEDLPVYAETIRQHFNQTGKKAGLELDFITNPYGADLAVIGAAAYVLEQHLA